MEIKNYKWLYNNKECLEFFRLDNPMLKVIIIRSATTEPEQEFYVIYEHVLHGGSMFCMTSQGILEKYNIIYNIEVEEHLRGEDKVKINLVEELKKIDNG